MHVPFAILSSALTVIAMVSALAAHSDADVTLTHGAGSTAAQAAPSRWTNDSDLALMSPRDYQVFQRQTRARGQILVSGRVRPDCNRVEARIVGKSTAGILPGAWINVNVNPVTRAFSSWLPISAGGWYRVEVRAAEGVRTVAQTTVEHVGVGEVFVGAGQSNSTNSGQEKIQETTGMVSAFGGDSWQLANDPMPGQHDHSTGGSFWPAFGDLMYERYHVPIGIASTGHGGTSINQWQPDGELYEWMLTRMHQLGVNGFRAVLWHQGESDTGMPTDEYYNKMVNLIRASTFDAGWEFPWFVAQVSYHSPQEPSFDSTRNAQKRLWDTGIALAGPDTDTLTGDNRDYNGAGIHMSPKGLHAHAALWVDKIGIYLDRALGR